MAKEEGRRKKEEGRRKREEGRGKKGNTINHNGFKRHLIYK
ncbi:hypothetical protein QUB60_11995 [Microcoleus sp. A2-C5]